MSKWSITVRAIGIAFIAMVATGAYELAQSVFPRLARSYADEILICTGIVFILSMVSLRRRQLDLLKHEKTNFDMLIEHVPGLACVISSERKLVRWNSRYRSALGYSDAELAEMPPTETVTRDYRELVPQIMGAAFETGCAQMEAALLTKDGSSIPCYLTGVRIMVDGQPNVLSVGIDISAQKRAEGEVRKSEEQYRRLLANLPDVIWTMNCLGDITYISPNVEEILGYKPEEVLGGGQELRLDRIHPEDADRVFNSYVAFFKEGYSFDLEYRSKHKDGRWIWIRNRALRTFEQDGARFADGIISDITQQKQAERVDSQLAAIVMSTNNAIIGKLVDGTIASWNPGAERMFGYSVSEATGRHISTLVAPERLYEVPSVLARVARGEHVERFDSVCLRKDGSRIEVSLAISPIMDKTGNVFGISTIANDISLRKRAENELLRAKEAAETATRAKTEFLANISHELRTPMNAILGMTDLALDTELDAEQRECLLTVRSSGNALMRLINDLLDFTKTDSGTLALDNVAFNLREMVRQTLRPLRFQAEQVGLEFLCQMDPGLPEMVVGDSQRLRQVLVNLVGNAIKFTERGRVAVKVVRSSRNDDICEFLFTIADTGIGISPEKHAVIFEGFTQSDSSSTRKYGGTGLGLAISARLVELMRGKIWLESELGRGSAFHFTVQLSAPVNSWEKVLTRDGDEHSSTNV
jgi:two-component system sensor histidine kinase/response regulator